MNNALKSNYDAAFRILHSLNDFCTTIESLGFEFEYEHGCFGKFAYHELCDAEQIIKNSLRLHEVEKQAIADVFGTPYRVSLYILYTEDNDDAWSITTDDFNTFLNKGQTSEMLRELMWDAIVNKNEEAKAKFNTMGMCGKIGPYDAA